MYLDVFYGCMCVCVSVYYFRIIWMDVCAYVCMYVCVCESAGTYVCVHVGWLEVVYE